MSSPVTPLDRQLQQAGLSLPHAYRGSLLPVSRLPRSPSRPWGLLSQASPCRQPQLTIKAQDRAKGAQAAGVRQQGPGVW